MTEESGATPDGEEYLPPSGPRRPPILLVHGAANSAWIWNHWAAELRDAGWAVYALALRGHRGGRPADPREITMDSYQDDVAAAVAGLSEPPVVIGWSLGGLVALMFAATRPDLPALVLLAPSPPREIQGVGDPADVAAIPDVFGPETYGIDVSGHSGRKTIAELTEAETARLVELMEPESGAARRQRKRGVAVPADRIRCPTLVLTGARDRQFPPAIGARVAELYSAQHIVVPGASHLGLVAHEPTARSLARLTAAWLKEDTLGQARAEFSGA